MALTDNLVSYWKLDESSGNAADSVGSNTLTNTNVTYAAAKINNGAVFNGSNASFAAPAATINPGTGGFTISAWIKTTSTAWFTIAMAAQATYPYIGLYKNNSQKARFYIRGTESTGYDYAGATSINDGNWHHIVLTTTGSSGKANLYVDGSADIAEVSLGSTTITIDTGKAYIGANGGASEFANGSIDEVGIWSRALSSDEIGELYNSGAGLQYPFSTTAIKTKKGLALASVKTFKGLATASVKTNKGLA